MCLCVRHHLGGEVPVEDALAVQVLQSPGDVQGQVDPHAPRQVHVAAQQLLQVTAIDVLDQGGNKELIIQTSQSLELFNFTVHQLNVFDIPIYYQFITLKKTHSFLTPVCLTPADLFNQYNTMTCKQILPLESRTPNPPHPSFHC